jgi:hypothetical protein
VLIGRVINQSGPANYVRLKEWKTPVRPRDEAEQHLTCALAKSLQ